MRRLIVAIILALLAPLIVNAQDHGDHAGEWRYIGGDAAHTRYSPLDQINAENFGDLEVAWSWRGDNYGPRPLAVSRSTPLYVDGMLSLIHI